MTTATDHIAPLVFRLGGVVRLDDNELFEVCRLNRDLRIERTAQGEIVVMPPTGAATGTRNAELTTQLSVWAKPDGRGVVFDSSTGFRLASGAVRSPDVAWVARDRLATLDAQQKERFLPLCPDFIAELRSPSDDLETLRTKMLEFIAAGSRLGWLIDPQNRSVEIYRPNVPVDTLLEPGTIGGEPVLTGFLLDLDPIWDVDI